LKNSSWQIKDVPQPQPGPNQVLVKMHASGICYTDVHLTLGHFPGPFPRILGHEPVGEIVAVAPDVTTRKVGDRVGTAWIQSTCGRCEWCQRGRRMFCPYMMGTGIEAQGEKEGLNHRLLRRSRIYGSNSRYKNGRQTGGVHISDWEIELLQQRSVSRVVVQALQ
jgi:threonine dehydrogenase-like Zn-dependent dehydrogenase